MQLSLMDIFNQMGNFAKGICFVLAVMSIWSLSIAIKKWWDLKQAQGETRKFAPEFSQFLEEDNLAEAVTRRQVQEVPCRPRPWRCPYRNPAADPGWIGDGG